MKELKLNNGQVIKNYIELCKLMGWKKTDGKSKRLQLKDLERYCTYHKDVREFIIDEVYDKPKPKVDGRINNGGQGNHTTYETLMDDLIMDTIYNESNICESFGDIFKDYIPLFSKNYSNFIGSEHADFGKLHNISKGLIMLYSQKLDSVVKKCFHTSLNRLQKDGYITWSKEYMTFNQVHTKDIADEKMTEEIKRCEKEVYDEMGISPYNRVSPKVNRKFKRKVCKMISDTNGIISYWNVYVIEPTEKEYPYNKPNINELIIRFVRTIHKTVENKSMENDYGKKINPYTARYHKKNTYKLDEFIWNLPDKWYENFLSDIFIILDEEENQNNDTSWINEFEVIPF